MPEHSVWLQGYGLMSCCALSLDNILQGVGGRENTVLH